MEENKYEILKRKRIRKLLLLKINDELKEIAKTKSNIRINSKTIQELNKIYNRNDILLYEKSTLYTNYIKTEETVISNISSFNLSKTINELAEKPISKGIIKNKDKNKRKEESIIQFDLHSLEEDSASPIMNFLQKKIELGRKKFMEAKPKPRHHESVHKISKKNVNLSKETNENKLNKSTKLGNRDLNLYELIEKITSIKNNESKEGIIRQNIKKLRNYCFQLRKRRKKIKINANKNNSSRKKSRFKEKKIERSADKKRSTILDKDVVEKSLFLIKQKLEGNKNNKSSIIYDISPSPSPSFNVNLRKKSTAKVLKLNLNNKYKINIIPPNKNQKNFSTIKNKEKLKKLQSVTEFAENKFLNKLNKKKKKKSLNGENKSNNKTNTEENIPSINQISKNLTRSTINEIRLKFDNVNDESDKNKLRINRLKYNHKKSLNKNTTTNPANNNNIKKNSLRYFNSINPRKDRVELHDNLNRSTKKIKNSEQRKENARKNEENNDEIIKLKKLSIVLDSRRKSKKKLIESPDRRVYRYSNFTNYGGSNIIIQDKVNKSFIRKSRKGKE